MQCKPQPALDSSENVKRRIWLAALGALCAIGPVSIDMYLPASTDIAVALGTEAKVVARAIPSYVAGVLVGQLIHGCSSDVCGRKPPLYVGLLLYCGASLACACVGNADWFLALRFLQGLGGSAGVVLARAMIQDRGNPREMASAFSALMLVASVAPLVAPLLGAAIRYASGWRAIFAAMGGVGVFLLALSTALPETRVHSRPALRESIRRSLLCREVLSDRQFLGCALSSGLLQGGMYAYISMSAIIFVDEYHLSPGIFGAMIAANSLGMALAAQVNGRLVRRVELPCIIKCALWASAASMAVIERVDGKPSAVILLAAVFVYLSMIGFVAPNCAALSLAKHAERAGAASALLGTMLLGIGAMSGSIALRLKLSDPVHALTLVMGACSLLATTTFHATQRYRPQPPLNGTSTH